MVDERLMLNELCPLEISNKGNAGDIGTYIHCVHEHRIALLKMN